DVCAWQKPSRHEPTEAADDTTSDTAPDPVADTGERPEPEAQDVSADTDVNVETDLFEDAAFDVDETVSTVTEPAAEVERPDTFDAFTDDPATMPVTSVSENHVGSVVPVLDDIDPLDFYGFSTPQDPAP